MFSDAHCDTITNILEQKQGLWQNDGHLDLVRLKELGFGLQFFAAWIDPKYEPHCGINRAVDIFDKFHTEAEKNSKHLHIIKSGIDIDYAIKNNKIGALLSIEGGGALGGRLSSLRMFYKLGVRAMTLTWNGRNEIADGVSEWGGLSAFGESVVREMNRLGMIVDVSHIAEKGFWDVAEVSGETFIASHSNAKSVCGHRRNLTDEQIKELIKRNGFMGINLYSDFLSDGFAKMNDIISHIEYVLSLGGENILGFGADFDGVDKLPGEIDSVSDMLYITEKLSKIGYNDELIDKIKYKNLHRVVKHILKN